MHFPNDRGTCPGTLYETVLEASRRNTLAVMDYRAISSIGIIILYLKVIYNNLTLLMAYACQRKPDISIFVESVVLFTDNIFKSAYIKILLVYLTSLNSSLWWHITFIYLISPMEYFCNTLTKRNSKVTAYSRNLIRLNLFYITSITIEIPPKERL